ncbi:unnamed protein product [Lactuca saligna]|uniref:Uncharacterized protein n=1 Tax=Lactuca saligna TaxID=75948 RepID=A0AA36A4E3_LACSI|nr:unnamed protein product [Lactuca saligna]
MAENVQATVEDDVQASENATADVAIQETAQESVSIEATTYDAIQETIQEGVGIEEIAYDAIQGTIPESVGIDETVDDVIQEPVPESKCGYEPHENAHALERVNVMPDPVSPVEMVADVNKIEDHLEA